MVLSIRTAVAADAPELAALAALTFPLACPPGSPPEEIQCLRGGEPQRPGISAVLG